MTSGHEPTVWVRPPLPTASVHSRRPLHPDAQEWGQLAGSARHIGPPPAVVPPVAPGPQAPYISPSQYGLWPGWAPASPTRRSTGPWWILGGLTVVSVIVVAVTLVLANSRTAQHPAAPLPAVSTSSPPKTPVPIGVADLAGLLPGPSEFAAAAGTGPRAAFRRIDRLFVDHIADEDCLGAVSTASDDVYQGSGWMAARAESLVPPGENTDSERGTWVGVVAYPDAARASAMYAKLVGIENKCAGRSVNTRDTNNPEDRDYFTLIGRPSEHDGVAVISRTDEGGEGWGCQNATTVRNNVVITAGICGNYVDPSVVESIVDKIAAKVTAQT